MGKSLIFNDADFSANAIPEIKWFVKLKAANLIGTNDFATNYKARMVSDELARTGLVGKTINVIGVYATAAGTIKVGNASFDSTPVFSNVQTYDVVQGYNIIALNTPLTFSSSLSFYVENTTTCLTYNANVQYDLNKGFKFNNSGTGQGTGSRIPMDFGYFG